MRRCWSLLLVASVLFGLALGLAVAPASALSPHSPETHASEQFTEPSPDRYDYDDRSDIACPPPVGVRGYTYDTPENLSDPAGASGLVHRALLGSDEGLVAPRTTPTGNAYSVAFETQLDDAVLGGSRSVHFNRANAALDDALRADTGFAAQFDELIPGASSAVSRTGGRATPGGYTWHHVPSSASGGRVGMMHLVPGWQHAPGSIWQRLLHPGGAGGYSEWAIPRGAPRN